jgi:predicted kinase
MKKNTFTKEVIIMVGIPGSGKSTYLNDVLLPKKSDYVICGTDNIFDERAAADGITYDEAYHKYSFKEVERLFKEKIWDAIDAGKSVIIDRTNLSRKSRNKMLSYFDMKAKGEYKKTCVWFQFEGKLDIIRERLKKREMDTGKTISERTLQDMLKQYVEPSKDEFHEIIKV